MKIGLISTAVPHVNGGGRFIVDWLQEKLVEQGHETEVIYIPTTDDPQYILAQIAAIRTMKLDDYFDRVITFRPPAHLVQHPRKIVWFIHHLRIFYDLWDTPYRGLPDNTETRALRSAIIACDNAAFREAHRLFTNSRVVGNRIKQFNNFESEVLYPPVLHPEMFEAGNYGDQIVSVCRMEHHKRQHLLVEAMAHTKTDVRLRLCGTTVNEAYIRQLKEQASRLNVENKIIFEPRWISEEEKAERLKYALASVYLPFDEDSYGYPTIEAAWACKATVTTLDSGGVLEFVTDQVTGLAVAPEAEAIANAFDRLYRDRNLAQTLGEASRQRITLLGIDWETVVAKLIA